MFQQLGLTPEYFKSLSCLNLRQTSVYTIVFIACFFFFGGFIPLLLASILAFIVSLIVHRCILNRRTTIPSNALIVVTGASSGMGKQGVLYWTKQQIHVVATVRKESDKAQLITEVGPNNASFLHVLLLDISKKEDINEFIKQIHLLLTSQHLSLHALINNAGYAQISMMEMLSDDNAHQQFETNVFGQIRLINAMIPLFREFSILHQKLRPKIINVSSVLGRSSVPPAGIYSASKHALVAITDAYRVELAQQGIDVISVEPGAIKSAFQDTLQRHKVQIMNPSRVEQYYLDVAEQLDRANESTLKNSPDAQIVVDVWDEIIHSPQPAAVYNVGYDAQISSILLSWFWPGFIDKLFAKAFASAPIPTATTNNTKLQ